MPFIALPRNCSCIVSHRLPLKHRPLPQPGEFMGTTTSVFLVYLLVLFPVTLLLPYSKILRGLAATVATLGLCVLLYDTIVYDDYGVHLSPFAFDVAFAFVPRQVGPRLVSTSVAEFFPDGSIHIELQNQPASEEEDYLPTETTLVGYRTEAAPEARP